MFNQKKKELFINYIVQLYMYIRYQFYRLKQYWRWHLRENMHV